MSEITQQGGVVIGVKKEGNKERIYFVGEDSHLLCIGATRSGKSRNLVVQSICTLGLAGESIVVSDPKAELFDYTSEFLKKLGYEVLVLDFKNPAKSQRYNLLQPIINAVNAGDTDKAEMLAWDLTNNLVGKPEGEKIWTNGECSIIAASILCVVCDNKHRPEYQNLTNVYWFIAEMVKTIGNKMPLLEYVKSFPLLILPKLYYLFLMLHQAGQGKLLYFSFDYTPIIYEQIYLCHNPYERFSVAGHRAEKAGIVYYSA